jgi:probable rRNA maturation factor
MINLDFQAEFEADNLPDFDQLNLWAQAALKDLKKHADLSVVIVGPEESQALNLEFRAKDKPTNVLSFPFEMPEELIGLDDDMANLLGDLIICAPVVEREAKEQNKPLEHHWAHMVVHGCLHLLGYDHIKDDEAEIMENLERTILQRLDIPDPYLITDE